MRVRRARNVVTEPSTHSIQNAELTRRFTAVLPGVDEVLIDTEG
jgi:hypothetical protein